MPNSKKLRVEVDRRETQYGDEYIDTLEHTMSVFGTEKLIVASKTSRKLLVLQEAHEG